MQDGHAALWETGFREVGVSFPNGIEWAQDTRLERCCGFVKKSLWRVTKGFQEPAAGGGSSPRDKAASKAWPWQTRREGRWGNEGEGRRANVCFPDQGP